MIDYKWKKISEELYTKIFGEVSKDLCVFGGFTNLVNNSRFDAEISTEWGFNGSMFPLLKSLRKPYRQDIKTDTADWDRYYYISYIVGEQE